MHASVGMPGRARKASGRTHSPTRPGLGNMDGTKLPWAQPCRGSRGGPSRGSPRGQRRGQHRRPPPCNRRHSPPPGSSFCCRTPPAAPCTGSLRARQCSPGAPRDPSCPVASPPDMETAHDPQRSPCFLHHYRHRPRLHLRLRLCPRPHPHVTHHLHFLPSTTPHRVAAGLGLVRGGPPGRANPREAQPGGCPVTVAGAHFHIAVNTINEAASGLSGRPGRIWGAAGGVAASTARAQGRAGRVSALEARAPHRLSNRVTAHLGDCDDSCVGGCPATHRGQRGGAFCASPSLRAAA